MAVLSNLRRRAALCLCPELGLDASMHADPRSGVWSAPCAVEIVNMSRSEVQVSHEDGTIKIVVLPKFESAAVQFRDGSLGLEYGPENGRGLTRSVEWPKGGEPKIETASRTDWDHCEAARWVREARSGWTVVDEMHLNRENSLHTGKDFGGLNERRVPRIDGAVEHE